MSSIVDYRRQSKDMHQRNRQRMIEHVQKNTGSIEDALEREIGNGNIEDMFKGGVRVPVPADPLDEPSFHLDDSGQRDIVFPGNPPRPILVPGNRFRKPKGQGQGQGGDGDGDGDAGQASPDGDGEDQFEFVLSEEEALDILFKSCELPNLEDRQIAHSIQKRREKAGISPSGSPRNIDYIESFKTRQKRLTAAQRPYNEATLDALKEQRIILKRQAMGPAFDAAAARFSSKDAAGLQIEKLKSYVKKLRQKYEPDLSVDDQKRLTELDEKIKEAEDKRDSTTSWDEEDLRYTNYEENPVPTTKAVMFCVMDVSGSMGDEQKQQAKLFYFFLNRFLNKYYKDVEMVFIRHTYDAEEVDEQTFFYDRTSGGTKVSSGLAKMSEIIKERYPPSEWNIYGAQASDGDNFGVDDDELCVKLLLNDLLPKSQAYFYTQLNSPYGSGSLWDVYKKIQEKMPEKLFMGKIDDRKDIWKVFKNFFSTGDAPTTTLQTKVAP